MTYHAQCSCGAIHLEMEGEPVIQCYCHCDTCRQFSGSPVNAPVLWSRDAVRFTAGEEAVRRHVGESGERVRYACGICNGLIGVELINAGLFDVFAGLVRDLAFTPTLHLNYENAVLPIKDGLPKFKDMPERAGGTGMLMPE